MVTQYLLSGIPSDNLHLADTGLGQRHFKNPNAQAPNLHEHSDRHLDGRQRFKAQTACKGHTDLPVGKRSTFEDFCSP